MDKLIELASKWSLGDRDGSKIKTLYGHDVSYLANVLIYNGLFLENLPILMDISRDSWKIHTCISDKARANHFESLTTGLFSKSQVNLVKSQPMISYMHSYFRLAIDFLLHKTDNSYLIDMPYLMSFLNELRTSFNCLCVEDRQIIKPSSRIDGSGSFFKDAVENASFLVYWAIIEAAKYCVGQKLAPDMSTHEFLQLLQKETLSPVTLANKVSHRFLVNFIQNLDKFIADRVNESSTGKHTFEESTNVEKFYKTNCGVFRSWFLKNRQNIARFSLVIDDPAECWRNTNIKLYLDLTTKFYGTNSSSRDPSFSQTLMSLNTKNWYNNLSLFALGAKQLHDQDLLYGLKTLTEFSDIISEYPPLSPIISNLEGSYEKTLNLIKDYQNPDDLTLIEFLNACIELNVLGENSHYIDKLEKGTMKDLYARYLDSKSICDVPKTRLDEVESWLGTWLDLNDPENISKNKPVKSCIDLVIPTCLNIIAGASLDDRKELIERTEKLVLQDYVSQCLFPPNFVDKNIKIYFVLFDFLKNELIDKSLVAAHSNDLYWNHLLHRHLSDLRSIGKFGKQNEVVDFIQLRAAKYHLRQGNIKQATKIAEDLVSNSISDEVKLRSSLLISSGRKENLIKILQQIESSDLSGILKKDLKSKVLRYLMRLEGGFQSVSQGTDSEILSNIVKQQDPNEMTLVGLHNLSDSTSLDCRVKTLLLLSKSYNERSQSSSDDIDLLNQAFNLDLEILQLLCESTSIRHRASSIECATRILSRIIFKNALLTKENLDKISNSIFIERTISVWVAVKNNLVSLITCSDDLSACWNKVLVNIVKQMGQKYPNLLIYSIIVNRLDLQNEMIYLSDESKRFHQEPYTLLLQNSFINDSSESSRKLNECKKKLTIWNELFNHIQSSTQFENSWSDVVMETERFLKEIRKISFLCGEFLQTLTMRICRRLNSFLDSFSRACNPKSGTIFSKQRLEECEKRLKTICDQAINPVKVLLNHSKRIGESQMTIYDMWFCETFSKQLSELEYRLNLLAKKRPLKLADLEKLVKSITELLAICRANLFEYNYNNRQKLFMELISPLLSRLQPSLIPMPGCCDGLNDAKKAPVTIYKISQTVNLIVSKTNPKKLKFMGSDGISRSFLLKAHDDLRLDQLIMDLFATINVLLMGNKKTEDKYRLRQYSVTPVSSRSGLIQWIEASSLCSPYKDWLNAPNGKKAIEELFESTCPHVCGDDYSDVNKALHPNCQPPNNVHMVDPFYQLLWAKAKPSNHSITLNRPSFSDIAKYRTEFDPSVFQSVIEQLTSRMPDDLVANQLWYKSNNSHSYWLKTQEFIHSCATMSIVGYLIGLGDRHPENILIDHETGEVIHIDYSICFELGKNLTTPEQVPFRLTQNMIRAFGFAGLEGGFTCSCRQVLSVLKDYKSVLLHLLAPINLSFMVCQVEKTDECEKALKMANVGQKFNFQHKNTSNTRLAIEMDMCSQESVELNNSPTGDLTDLLTLNPKEQMATCEVNLIKQEHPISPPFDLQHNIKTPTKIQAKTASNIHQRLKDKLSGTDECLRHHKYRKSRYVKQLLDNSAPLESSMDLIMLNDAQSTEDQVAALISEATSIENKALMYEGWVPWI